MKLRKIVTAACLALGLAFAAPAVTNTFTTDTSTVQAAESAGWHKDSKGYYYINSKGVRQTGWFKWQNKYLYYFDSTGHTLPAGTHKINNVTYYFLSNGAVYTGKAGVTKIGSKYYYFNTSKNGSVKTNAWILFKGRYYIAGPDGAFRYGSVKVNGKLYYITNGGRITGLKRINGLYYYAAANGVLKTGWQKVNGVWLYFDPATGASKTGLFKESGKYYYTGTNGIMRTGVQVINGYTYYFNSDGSMHTGWLLFRNRWYYFNPRNGVRCSGNIKVGNAYYYLNKSGILQTGWYKVGGYWYYSTASGVRKTGWLKDAGYWYYLNPTTYRMAVGWQKVAGKWYYLNPGGDMATGWKQIGGYWYYLDQSGAMKTGWLLDNMKWYYLDPSSGRMYTGTRAVDGKVYNFGTSGGFTAVISGSWSIRVNRAANAQTITVYKGGTAVKAIACSTAADGVSTPLGTFSIRDKLRWWTLDGPSYGQYCSHLTSNILFHSVPCTSPSSYALKPSYYNQLGSPASAGCIRMNVADAKWIYDNCPIGTPVTIYEDSSSPGPLGKPATIKIPLNQTWDPTDPAV